MTQVQPLQYSQNEDRFVRLQVIIALILCNVRVIFGIGIVLGKSILGLGIVVVRNTPLELSDGNDRVEYERHPVRGVDLPCGFQSRINKIRDGAGDVLRVGCLWIGGGGRRIVPTLT